MTTKKTDFEEFLYRFEGCMTSTDAADAAIEWIESYAKKKQIEVLEEIIENAIAQRRFGSVYEDAFPDYIEEKLKSLKDENK